MRAPLWRERIYVFVYKAGRHMMERYLSIDYSVHLKVWFNTSTIL